MPDFNIEKLYEFPVIGVDEVGRGSLAGPVVSCACIFYDYLLPKNELDKIKDSKKLTHLNRKKILINFLKLKNQGKLNFRLGSSSVEEIDKNNILNATLLSMKRAIKKLKISKGTIIVDGNIKFSFNGLDCKNFIKGDQKSISIAAASIIAKVHRDRYMRLIGSKYPDFKWHKNAGYGTSEHYNLLKLNRITKYHRKSFEPIKSFIQNKNSNC